jgi:hypothetical protein
VNLAGRRIRQDFTDHRVPALTKAIAEFCPGARIAVTIDWDSFEGDMPGLENLWTVYEQPSQGLEEVCKDDLGRQAVAEGLHEIVIRDVRSEPEIGAEVDSGRLIVRIRCADAQSGTPGWAEIARVLTESL